MRWLPVLVVALGAMSTTVGASIVASIPEGGSRGAVSAHTLHACLSKTSVGQTHPCSYSVGSWTPIDGTHWPHIVLMSPAYSQGHRSPHRSEALLHPTSAFSDHHFSACMSHHDDVCACFL
jgi:hypothetical protein